MPSVPLPTGFQSISEFPRLKENLINMMNVGANKLIQRAGIVGKGIGLGSCRGQIKFQDELYQVSGTKLIKIGEDGTIIQNVSDEFSLDVEGVAECVLSVGFTFLVIIVKGGRGYTWNNTAFVEITDEQFQASDDLTYINGRWVFVPTNGDPAFFTDALDPLTINGFFDAETQPDKNSGTENFKNRLYIFGEETMEVFRDTGQASPVFVRIEGASIWTGLVAGHVFWGDSLVFLGKDKDQNFGFFQLGSGNAPRISNGAVDELLNDEYTAEELKTCIAQRYQWKGQDIAVFRLPRHTICYNGAWFFSSSIATYEERQETGNDFKTWRANYITHCYGEYYVGDVESADIGVLDDAATDYGNDVEYGFDTFVRTNRGAYFTARSLELDGVAGQASPERSIGLSLSDDGLTYSDLFYIGMGEVGEYQRRMVWEFQGGLGDYENYMGIKIRTTAPVEIAGEGLEVVV